MNKPRRDFLKLLGGLALCYTLPISPFSNKQETVVRTIDLSAYEEILVQYYLPEVKRMLEQESVLLSILERAIKHE